MTGNLTVRKPTTKAQDAFERLSARARAMEPNAKLPTVQELRRELGVSLTTLDAVLGQLENQNIIFRRQGSGIFVSPRLKQRCIGLVCDPRFFRPGSSPFWSELIEGARAWASVHGEAFRFYMAVASEREGLPISDDLIEDVRAQRLQGVIFVGNNLAATRWLEEQGLPVVTFGGQGKWKVHIGYTALVVAARQYLAAKGFNDPAVVIYGEERSHNFQLALAEMGMPLQPGRVAFTRPEADAIGEWKSAQEEGYAAILRLFGPNRQVEAWPDSLILTDDMVGRGALVALRRLGIQPGRDLEVISHTNVGSSVMHGHEDELSFVEIDPAAVVRGVFDILEGLMDGREPNEEITCIPPVEGIRERVESIGF